MGVLGSVRLEAKHVFGGYIGIKQVSKASANFQVLLTFYTDLEEMDVFDLDDAIQTKRYINIFRKRDNALIQTVTLQNATIRDLIYDNQACAKSLQLRTREYRLSADVSLSPTNFSDPQGYYMAWDLCCRNAAISNLVNPKDASMLVYSEMPALFVNGQAVAYSSPEFSELNGDYICINKAFTYNFSATDADGDELRYSLVTPYRGATTEYFPNEPAKAGPYANQSWAGGYSATNAIPGSAPLRIDPTTGYLTVRASQVGIYSFVVQVDEYRNGQKIGSVRHEFQLPVIDCSNQTLTTPLIRHNNQPAETLTICPGESLTLTTATDPAWAFQWQEKSENIKGATANTFVIDKPGEYAVVKSLAKQCAADVSSKSVVVSLQTTSTSLQIQTTKKDICTGEEAVLSTVSSTTLTYEWLLAGNVVGHGPSYTATSGGDYELTGKAGSSTCSITSAKVTINLWPLPVLPPFEEVAFCPLEKPTVELKTVSNPEWQYQWTHEDKVIGQTPIINVRKIGMYYVDVITSKGCRTRSLPQNVVLAPNCRTDKLFIPTAFSPNQDGLNDVWDIQNIDLSPNCEVYVYTRWGELIYQSLGYKTPWDGRYAGQPVNSGIYTYIVKQNSATEYRGTLTLLR
jgi:gliding motility-associated-like protein